MWYESLLSRELLPDSLIRLGIRRQLKQKLMQIMAGGPGQIEARQEALVSALRESPIAIDTDKANEQHYELPADFFSRVLGPHLKYSSGLWENGTSNLAQAEEAMLQLYVERAEIQDGQEILDLGCGWGSLSLYLARRFPRCQILGLSNSSSQKAFILNKAAAAGLKNLRIETANIVAFDTPQRFDRIISIEMFEHMRNYSELFKKTASWLKPEGRLFIHIFTHRAYAYPFEAEGSGSWMARYFFSGGMMPSWDLFLHFQESVQLLERWKVDGRHYQKTCEAWLAQMDQARPELMPLFIHTYGAEARKWWMYWRVFFMACAELFGFHDGQEWFVSHYLFKSKS